MERETRGIRVIRKLFMVMFDFEEETSEQLA
jgi:hypothetical protein